MSWEVLVASSSIIFSAACRDTPRKRSGAPSGSSGPGRGPMTVSNLGAEPQPEEVVDENFPVNIVDLKSSDYLIIYACLILLNTENFCNICWASCRYFSLGLELNFIMQHTKSNKAFRQDFQKVWTCFQLWFGSICSLSAYLGHIPLRGETNCWKCSLPHL